MRRAATHTSRAFAWLPATGNSSIGRLLSFAEIVDDPALQRYGVCLALINALTAYYWLRSQPVAQILSPTQPPICWPFIKDCGAFRILSETAIATILSLIFVAAIVNAWLFTKRSWIRFATWLLLTISATKVLVLFQDYRLILNQHYMANWIIAAFILVPGKRRALQYLIVMFYFWAGLLKLSEAWLSGAALYGKHPLGLPDWLIGPACVYVVFLELTVGVGLLSKRTGLFWAAFLQLILFHVSSFWVVGYYYPMLMFLILPIFVLVRYGEGRATAHPLPRWSADSAFGRAGATSLVAMFSLMQLVPAAFPGSSAITGEGRMFALHMFDAPVECRGVAILHRDATTTTPLPLRAPFLERRIACDPIVYLGLAKNECRAIGSFTDFDLRLESRISGQHLFHTVVFVPSFCRTAPVYSVWHHNWWIEPDSR